jgi:hypothetical protein
MGIHKFSTWQPTSVSKEKKRYDEETTPSCTGLMGDWKVGITTRCGWVLKLKVPHWAISCGEKGGSNHLKPKAVLKVLLTTPLVKYLDSSNKQVEGPVMFSVPEDSVASVALSSGVICVPNVKGTQMILPDTDKRVLGSSSESNHDNSHDTNDHGPSLQLVETGCHGNNSTNHSGAFCRIPLSNSSSVPHCLAIHPSHEWIVLGYRSDHPLQLFCTT